MMGKYCGDLILPSHVSSSNEILIHFKSGWSATRAGFKMEYNPTGRKNTPIQNNTESNMIEIDRKFWDYSSFLGTFICLL